MAYHSGALEASLTAVLGDDPALVADLRQSFFEGIARHLAAIDDAATEAAIRDAAARLRGLAASFGADRLMQALSPAIDAGCLTAPQRRRIDRVVAMMKAH
jgi:histidine phosphotransfer protein HptB